MDNTRATMLPKWIKVEKYCELTGYTSNAIHGKKNNGILVEGKHWIKAPDGKIMVNWDAMDTWIENGFKQAA